MASCTLQLGLPRTSVHVAFSSASDHLAVLSHSGAVALWDLRTRIEFSRDKALDPVELCTVQFELDGCFPRQVVLQGDCSSPNTFCVACLTSNGNEDTALLGIVKDEVLQSSRTVDLPGGDGRFLQSETGVYWQSSEGKLFSSTCDYLFILYVYLTL